MLRTSVTRTAKAKEKVNLSIVFRMAKPLHNRPKVLSLGWLDDMVVQGPQRRLALQFLC